MDMHSRTIVAEHRLRHEGRRLAVALRHLVDAIFVNLKVVGHRRQRPELQAELMLRRTHLVVVLFDLGAHLRHGGEHFATHVLRRILRRHRKIAALGAHAMTEVAALVGGVRIRRKFGGIEDEPGIVGVRLEADVIEHEKLGFRPEIDGVADPCGSQIGFGLLGDAAWITVIGFAGRGIENVAYDR
ncbi:MAG: hypothetical protein USCAAHI_02060 [Beijerinckiaceae bacterium]|nr:MAG: hypothetical protein USCAAHI_02060 [Beijerinckiaceae bacterium]